jgi:predicted nuclease of predicted toxin-antitoxin system
MKLLFDQNLSFKLVKLIEEYFPESSHVSNEKLLKADDLTIWQFAKHNDFTIVTQDVDFLEISLIKGIPPKIIWLRLGNSTTLSIFNTLILNYNSINNFLLESGKSCLQIF